MHIFQLEKEMCHDRIRTSCSLMPGTFSMRGGLVKKCTWLFSLSLLVALAMTGCTSTRAPSMRCTPPAPQPDSALICIYRIADNAPSAKTGVFVNNREIGRLQKQSGIWLIQKPGDAFVVASMTDGRDSAITTNRIACVAGRTHFLRIDFHKIAKGKTNIAFAGPGEAVTPLVVGGLPTYRYQPLLQIIQEPDARAELTTCANVPAWMHAQQ